jgi:hypothetical protein
MNAPQTITWKHEARQNADAYSLTIAERRAAEDRAAGYVGPTEEIVVETEDVLAVVRCRQRGTDLRSVNQTTQVGDLCHSS